MHQTEAPPRWHFTRHLRVRAAERGFSEVEVYKALHEPEVVYDQDDYAPNRQVRQRGRLGVVVNRSTGAVITVVFRSPNTWRAHLQDGGAA
ncbi:MAG TPA: DUF4258 domain-containing protein [Acidimicrobiales bacterium]|nr:DUF4258 domain-containing protein [Acidimicrobiales bacterium]